jgi:hypothetical protein
MYVCFRKVSSLERVAPSYLERERRSRKKEGVS